jgi:hypothetical protein
VRICADRKLQGVHNESLEVTNGFRQAVTLNYNFHVNVSAVLCARCSRIIFDEFWYFGAYSIKCVFSSLIALYLNGRGPRGKRSNNVTRN